MIIKPYIDYKTIAMIAKDFESPVFRMPTEPMVNISKAYGAYEKGEPLAYVLLMKEYGDGLYSIPSLATGKDYQGRGIMKQLLLEAFISSEAKKIWLEVHQDNKAGRALYASLGFVETSNPNCTYPDGTPIIMCEVTLNTGD